MHAEQAGEYRVCLGDECRSFTVPQVHQVKARTEVFYPNLVLGDTLRLTLRNRGNTPLSLTVRPERPVRFPSQALTLEMEQERTLDLEVPVPEEVVQAFLHDLAAVDPEGFRRMVEEEEVHSLV
jgi:hypothetical protein